MMLRNFHCINIILNETFVNSNNNIDVMKKNTHIEKEKNSNASTKREEILMAI